MESCAHFNLKNQLYAAIKERGFSATMETNIDSSRPDILIHNIKGNKLAVEIQKSALSPSVILNRMEIHTNAGAHTLWLIPEDVLANILYHRIWCELIQKLQYGFVFIPIEGGGILPAHIDCYYGMQEKYIDKCESPLELEDLLFETNPETRLNTTHWKEWWLASYIEIDDIMTGQKVPKRNKMPTKTTKIKL